MEVDNIFLYQQYFKASVKIILVKVAMKTSPLVLHGKKADLKSHHYCFAFFHFTKNCKYQTPSQSQCRGGSNLMMAVTTGKWKGRGREEQDRVLHKRHSLHD